ncbi:MAG: MBL fold metallo-hydrolase [Deltaproteobacteria bacterium]|nr:MBL fold metallo-hydrolase [Deltaproteobacteria bacterium]
MKLNKWIYFYRENGMLDCNTYLIKNEKTMIVDVGLDKNLPLLLAALKEDGIDLHEIDLVVNTHLHVDHAWANTPFKEKSGALIELAPVQKEHYPISVRQTSRFFGLEPIEFDEDGLLNTSINLGTEEVDIIHTPGHSPDSVCFYCKESKALICGDLIFDCNTGRSDLPGGNGEQLRQSINKIAELDIELLLPGHMDIITDKTRIKQNFEYVRANVFPWL